MWAARFQRDQGGKCEVFNENMDQSPDILIQKLSTPVEELAIDTHARHQLKHTSLYTAAEILLTGKPRLRSLRNIGAVSADRIWDAVSHHLGLPGDQLAVAALPQEKDYLETWDTPITVLPLTQRTFDALRSMGVSRIAELIKARPAAGNKFLGMEEMQLDEIEKALCLHMVQTARARLLDLTGLPAFPAPPSLEATPVADMALPLPKLSERDWALLEYRGMQLASLKQTGAKFGLSKGSLRRTIEQAYDQLRRKMVFLSLFLDHFERKSEALQKDLLQGSLDLGTLALHLLSEPVPPELAVEEWQAERLILLMRSMVLQPDSWFQVHIELRWPSFILASCLVEPAITKHNPVKGLLRARKLERKNKTYAELAYQILAKSGKPMHVFAIAEEARQLGRRNSIRREAVQNILITRKDLFLRVGQGVYALAEWGGQAPENYPAIIASVLREANRPMPMDWIREPVSAIRPIKPSSLRMMLNLHVRFYKSIQNTYGLRAWLPKAGDAQKTSLPDWQMEAPDSLKRVERASAKGIDVEKIVAQDRLL
jgi:hypothetical protein